jgi:ElaB/YqjD/DUF883 family membrane-anchored ribosome-binding protein
MKQRTAKLSAETPQQLIKHINRFMTEAEAMLAGPFTEPVSEEIVKIRSRLNRVSSRIASIYGHARRGTAAGARFTNKTIRAHPYKSLAVALGTGVLLGGLLRRPTSA